MRQAIAILALILIFLTGCSSSTSNTEMNGEAIYSKSCSVCHGDKLQGFSGPTLVNIKSKYSEDEIQKIITKGTQRMPANLIADEQAKIVTKWLMTK